ncbi:MAG: DEAD/DEAH box helicase [Flavobacteriales bacterium]|nr:DEAD/DEAH box helicase [Flavobacteriales bacterium]
MVNFEELKLTRQLLNALEDSGFDTPTPIQQKAIPIVRAGQDLIGIAQTGTGKTAAYLLPLLQVVNYAQGDFPRCLILVPTKELVIQVKSQMEALAHYTDLRIVALYGGVGPKTQIAELEAGCDFVVATPGRLIDLYLKGGIEIKKIKHLVLDEADKMMDMGFFPQLRQIQEFIPQKKQNLLFSATFPPKVESLAADFLLWPQRVEIAPQATPVETVDQLIYRVDNFRTKLSLLMHLLEDEETFHRVLVFVRTREMATNIGKYLDRKGLSSRVIHSNKGQNSRINAMEEFRQGEVRILVSTDVSARGIDVKGVSHVINFSVPRVYEDYVHRIGRTGRALMPGVAISFVDRAETYHIGKIEKLIQQQIERAPFPEEVEVTETPKQEKQLQDREIDAQKKRENPDFKGAFHERKKKSAKSGAKRKPGRGSSGRRGR